VIWFDGRGAVLELDAAIIDRAVGVASAGAVAESGARSDDLSGVC
jgi:hypothetical protein